MHLNEKVLSGKEIVQAEKRADMEFEEFSFYLCKSCSNKLSDLRDESLQPVCEKCFTENIKES